ncbi:MAG: vWA domain-containing protein [Treponemataceae bacterium]
MPYSIGGLRSNISTLITYNGGYAPNDGTTAYAMSNFDGNPILLAFLKAASTTGRRWLQQIAAINDGSFKVYLVLFNHDGTNFTATSSGAVSSLITTAGLTHAQFAGIPFVYDSVGGSSSVPANFWAGFHSDASGLFHNPGTPPDVFSYLIDPAMYITDKWQPGGPALGDPLSFGNTRVATIDIGGAFAVGDTAAVNLSAGGWLAGTNTVSVAFDGTNYAYSVTKSDPRVAGVYPANGETFTSLKRIEVRFIPGISGADTAANYSVSPTPKFSLTVASSLFSPLDDAVTHFASTGLYARARLRDLGAAPRLLYASPLPGSILADYPAAPGFSLCFSKLLNDAAATNGAKYDAGGAGDGGIAFTPTHDQILNLVTLTNASDPVDFVNPIGPPSPFTIALVSAAVGTDLRDTGNTLLAAPLTLNYSIDLHAPTVLKVESSSTDGYYKVLGTIDITVKFSEPVMVDTAGGTPTLALNSGGAAVYSGGSGTDTLAFQYQVGAGQNSADLDYTPVGALSLNWGTIRDAAGKDASLTLPVVGGAASISGTKAIVVDTTAPTVSLTDNRGSKRRVRQGSLIITAKFIDTNGIDDVSAPRITIGSFVTNQPMTETTNLEWYYDWPVPSGNNGVDATVSITAVDKAGNPCGAPSGIALYTIDNTPPSGYVVSITTDPIDAANQTAFAFTLTGAEVGARYAYEISSDGDGGVQKVSDQGDVAALVPTGIDVSALTNGTLTLSLTLTDEAGNVGTAATDTVLKTVAAALPAITGVVYDPSDGWLKIGDSLTATISTDAAVGGLLADSITINGKAATDFSDLGNGSYSVRYTVANGDADVAQTASIPLSAILKNASGAATPAYTTPPAPAACPGVDTKAPQNIVFVLDVSGSMNSDATFAGTPKKKVEWAKDAVINFVSYLLTHVASTDYRVGLVVYSSDGAKTMDLTDKSALTEAAVSAAMVWGGAGNLTAMGKGLAWAHSILQYDGVPYSFRGYRSIVMLADGQQNVPPFVVLNDNDIAHPGYDEFTIDTALAATGYPPGMGNIQVRTTDKPIPIHTLGIGGSADWFATLAGVSHVTDGQYYTNGLIWPLVFDSFMTLLPSLFPYSSPQIVRKSMETFTASARKTYTFGLNASVKSLTVCLNWAGKSALDITLAQGKHLVKFEKTTKKNGLLICTAKISGSPSSSALPYQLRVFEEKPQGIKNYPYLLSIIADEKEIKYAVDPHPLVFWAGESLPLGLKLKRGPLPVESAPAVYARIDKPSATPANLIGTKPGLITSALGGQYSTAPDAAREQLRKVFSQKEVIEKLSKRSSASVRLGSFFGFIRKNALKKGGSLTAAFGETSIPGSYRVDFEISMKDAKGGVYERVVTRTALAMPKPELEYSILDGAMKVNELTITFIPKDRFGNFLGAGYGTLFASAGTGFGRLKVEDKLDGAYIIRVPIVGKIDGPLFFKKRRQAIFNALMAPYFKSRGAL